MKYIIMMLFTILLVSCVNEQNKKVKIDPTSKKIIANKPNAIAIMTEADIETAIKITKDNK